MKGFVTQVRTVAILAIIGVMASAQTVETRRPTAQAADTTFSWCSSGGTNIVFSGMPNFFDSAGLSTSSNIDVNPSQGTWWMQGRFTNWQAPTAAYSSLSLKVNTSCQVFASGPVGRGQCTVEYSTNGGSSWTTIYDFSSTFSDLRPQGTDSVILPANQDLSQLVVRACISANADELADPIPRDRKSVV